MLAPLSQETLTSQFRFAGIAGTILKSKVELAGSEKPRLTKSESYVHFDATPLWSVM